MADFEADKTSGTGPALVMVHPLKVNDTEAADEIREKHESLRRKKLLRSGLEKQV